MTDKKHFFMSKMTAAHSGRMLMTFNVVSTFDQRNLSALVLQQLQHQGASMIPEQVEFDDVVIDNIFYLGEMTMEEFTKGTGMSVTVGEAPQEDAEAVHTTPSYDQSELDAQGVESIPVDDVTTADVKSSD